MGVNLKKVNRYLEFVTERLICQCFVHTEVLLHILHILQSDIKRDLWRI